MEKAFEKGDHEKALKLSRQLDRQILKSYPNKNRQKKSPKKDKDRDM